jgi:hypothetical protein
MRTAGGSITVDFIFGITLVACVSAILLSLCFTMAMVEFSQYIAFASSRVYFGAGRDEATQISRADQKFTNLVSNRVIKKILEGDWFKLAYVGTGDFRSLYQGQINFDNGTFFGTRLQLTASILNLRLPLIGSTSDSGYKAYLTSYLGREPSFQECADFMKERWGRYSQKFPRPQGATPPSEGAYEAIMDNGC